MTVKIFDYANSIINVELPIKSADEISKIFVQVISGDETGHFELKNGETIFFNSFPNGRIIGFDDGCYVVEGKENIKKWLNFTPDKETTFSYQRQGEFD